MVNVGGPFLGIEPGIFLDLAPFQFLYKYLTEEHHRSQDTHEYQDEENALHVLQVQSLAVARRLTAPVTEPSATTRVVPAPKDMVSLALQTRKVVILQMLKFKKNDFNYSMKGSID